MRAISLLTFSLAALEMLEGKIQKNNFAKDKSDRKVQDFLKLKNDLEFSCVSVLNNGPYTVGLFLQAYEENHAHATVGGQYVAMSPIKRNEALASPLTSSLVCFKRPPNNVSVEYDASLAEIASPGNGIMYDAGFIKEGDYCLCPPEELSMTQSDDGNYNDDEIIRDACQNSSTFFNKNSDPEFLTGFCNITRNFSLRSS